MSAQIEAQDIKDDKESKNKQMENMAKDGGQKVKGQFWNNFSFLKI